MKIENTEMYGNRRKSYLHRKHKISDYMNGCAVEVQSRRNVSWNIGEMEDELGKYEREKEMRKRDEFM